MTDLTTTYLGLALTNPLVASACPLTGSIDSLLQLEAAGAGAVVLPSLFEEEVEHDLALLTPDYWGETNPEAHGGYLPTMAVTAAESTTHLDLLIEAKRELTVPVIGSVNGDSDGGWVYYAGALEDCGADAVELNVYHIAADVDATSLEVEDRYLRLVERVRAEIDVPLAVKVGPFFSSPANMARRLAEAGADGLVLFNRFYQPDIDLETLTVQPNLVLSTPAEMRLVLRWMAILRGRVDADLAATTGVHDAEGAVKLLLAGADVIMLASALLRNGPEHIGVVRAGLEAWLTDRGYHSADQARGSVSQASVADPSTYERVNYLRTLSSWGRTSLDRR